MNHEGREGLEGREEGLGRLTGGDASGRIIGLAIKVHKTVGPGLLEQIYEDCLCHELELAGLAFERQVQLSLVYNGARLSRAYRADIVVEQSIIIEIKSIDHILPVHEAQVLTYLRLSGCHVGLLLNFNTTLLKHGLRRFVQGASSRPS